MGMICWSDYPELRVGELVGAAGFEPTTTTPPVCYIHIPLHPIKTNIELHNPRNIGLLASVMIHNGLLKYVKGDKICRIFAVNN